MSALPHFCQRLYRWWLAACWRARIKQLDALISQIEADMVTDVAVLHVYRYQRRTLVMRLEVTRLAQLRRNHPRATR